MVNAWVEVMKHFTFLISSHISLAVKPFVFPEMEKQGHSETWTLVVSWAAIANVTGDCPFAVLGLEQTNAHWIHKI